MNKYLWIGAAAAIAGKIIKMVVFIILLFEAVHYLTGKEWEAATAHIAALILIQLYDIEGKL